MGKMNRAAVLIVILFVLNPLDASEQIGATSKIVNIFTEQFGLAMTSLVVGNYSYTSVSITDKDLIDFCTSNNLTAQDLFAVLNSRNIYVKNDKGYFYEGQVKIVMRGTTAESIFAVSRYHAYYMDTNVGVLNIYSAEENKWTSAFSAEAQIDFDNIPDNVRGVGLALVIFAKYAQNTEGLGLDQIKQEMHFMLNNFGVFLTDEKGVIIDSIFHRAQFRLMDGRVGTFTVTGQIDPNTKKGYNWAMVKDIRLFAPRNIDIYAGLGGDMVDVKTLLTDAKYKDLALTILNNKTLVIEPVVREEGKRLLQSAQLNGIAGEIKKFLE